MRLKLLVAGVVAAAGLWAYLPMVSVGAPSARRLSKIEDRLRHAQKRAERKRSTERVLTTEISGYSARINRLQSRISVLQGREARVQADLDRKRAALVQTQAELRAQRARLVRLRARLGLAREVLATRLVELYQSDKPDLVTVVLSSNGFADLVERADFIKRISDQDRAVISAVRTAKAQATSLAQQLDALEQRQQALTERVLVERNQIADVKQELVDVRVGYDRARAVKRRALSGVRVSRRHLESEVRSLRAEQAKVQKVLLAAAGTPSLPAGPVRGGGGSLIWPVNGPITSPFCERRSYESCHPGLDIGVPEGTPIRAAASGRVVLMQPTASSGGYGNYTCLQHTRAMSTCYAHQQRFGTSMGATVRQSQVIGYVGNTGHSFGAHLHFEVRINGAVTNPLNYL